jgi:hypothetical protein
LTQTETTQHRIAHAARDLIADLAAAIGDEASHEFGPYASVWLGMRRTAALPLHVRIDNPEQLAAQITVAGAKGVEVLARQAMITYLIDRQANARDDSRSWWQKIIDLATEIAARQATTS